MIYYIECIRVAEPAVSRRACAQKRHENMIGGGAGGGGEGRGGP